MVKRSVERYAIDLHSGDSGETQTKRSLKHRFHACHTDHLRRQLFIRHAGYTGATDTRITRNPSTRKSRGPDTPSHALHLCCTYATFHSKHTTHDASHPRILFPLLQCVYASRHFVIYHFTTCKRKSGSRLSVHSPTQKFNCLSKSQQNMEYPLESRERSSQQYNLY